LPAVVPDETGLTIR
jgi:hypothetical protein